ncbi:MAG TPA: hypothetical protein PK970_08695 [Hyphomicrobiaceae bacterium]|nr:hypothetical protein [Hyphomicrobiaceae bacterium]
MCTCGCQLAISAELARIAAETGQSGIAVTSTAEAAAVATSANATDSDGADLRKSGNRVALLLSLFKSWFITHSSYARAAR